MKKPLVIAALCASAVLGGGNHPVQAGHWERLVPVDESGNDLTGQAYLDWIGLHGKLYNGNLTIALASDPVNKNWDDEGTWFHVNWGDGVWHSINTSTAFNDTTSDTSTNHVSSGTVRAKYKWVRNKVNGDDDPNDNPPPVLWLRIKLDAVAEVAGDRLYSSSTTSLEASANGNSIPIDVNNGPDGWGSYYMQKITQDNNTQYLLVPVITNGADIVSTPLYPLSVEMDAQYNANASLWTYQKMEFSAKEDDRRLHLTRTGAIGEIVSGNTTYGHSRFSYIEQQTPLPVDAPQVQEYVRNISGDWGIDPDWEWSPASIDEAAMYSTQTNEYGNLTKDAQGKWTGTPTTPRVQTTKYTLTDPIDGTVGEAVYELILHDAYEKKSEDPLTTTMQNLRPHPYAIPGRASGPNQTVTVGLSNSYTWTVGGSFGGTIEAAQITTLDASIELSRSATVESNASIAVPVPEGWETYLQIYDRVDTRSGQAYSWLPAGYNGEVSWEVTYPSNTPTHFGVQAAPPYPIEEED